MASEGFSKSLKTLIRNKLSTAAFFQVDAIERECSELMLEAGYQFKKHKRPEEEEQEGKEDEEDEEE